MKKIKLKNLQLQALEESKAKDIKGGNAYSWPNYYCGDYYCCNINPRARCCPPWAD